MSMRSWIRSLFTRPATRPIRKTARRFRPALEMLEDRWCPSTLVVNSVLDNVNDANITGPTITLREAVNYENANGGGAITFDPTAFPTATPQTINLASSFGQLELMTKTETITGPAGGVTVNGGGASRVFLVDAGVTASISGLTISGGMAAGTSGNGGGLANFGNTTLSNCTLSGNSAGYLGGGVYGGADSTTTLTACTVSGNSAVFGGGLNSHGTLTLMNQSTVSNNSATDDGGALENYLGTTTLTDCTVSGNKSTVGGGGLLLVGGQTTLTNCTISGNSATLGGGLWAKQATVQPSHFRHSSDNYLGTTTLTNCTVSGNTATTRNGGGGVYNEKSNVTLQYCTISGNSTLLNGGGVYARAGSTTSLTNCIVTGNSAEDGGGGIFNFGTLTVTGSTLSGNSAEDGGGINNNGSAATATVTGSTLSGNSAVYGGGGISNAGGTLTLTGSTLSSNTAQDGGGLNTFGKATVTGSTLSGNSAKYGGGVYNGGTETLTNCTVSGNSAGVGGGLYIVSGATTLTNCTVSGNSATSRSGGGICRYSNGSVTLGNTIVAGNTANGDGPDVCGTMKSLGHNLIGKTDGSSYGWVKSDLKGTIAAPLNPLLAPLGDYGGPTQTMPLLPGSPALDAGSNDLIPTGVTTDQRGSVPFTGTLTSGSAVVRGLVSTTGLHVGQAVTGTGVASGTTILKVNSTDNTITLSINATGNGSSNFVASNPRIVNGTVDIGAFESSGFTIAVVSGNGQLSVVNTNFLALVVQVTANNSLEPVAGGLVTFTAPTGKVASASFNGTTATTVTVPISANGTASVTAKANGTLGSYSVTATARGITNSVIFSLTNKKKGT